jgi:uroporphyrin-3 C-methyltransferase
MSRVALGLAVLALGSSALLWSQLQAARRELARHSTDTSTTATEARTLAAQAESLVQELQARLGVAELRLSEVSLQRSQLEELMLTVSRTRDDSLVQDLESALRLAQQQAELTGSAQPLISALQSADQRIARVAQPRLNPVQRAIARDIDRIRAASVLDVPALALRLDELAHLVDDLPLANAVDVPAPERRAQRQAPDGQTAPAKSAAQDGSAWLRLQSWWQDWAGRAWSALTTQGGGLVRVHRVDRPEAALLAPEQAFFLRENAKLQLLNARLALLARQMDTARSGVQAVDALLGRYFDGRARATAIAREALQGLQRDLRAGEMPRPDESLAALGAAARGR